MEELTKNLQRLTVDKPVDKTVEFINNKIQETACFDTINKLTDESLKLDYLKSRSTIKKIKRYKQILIKHGIPKDTVKKCTLDYVSELVPPGTKGVIRGNKFNQLVKEYISNLKLDSEIFEIRYETKHPIYITDELPDWYIYNKHSNRILIGMNQIDLWSGGSQLNRSSKYIHNNKHNTKQSKLICVVCNVTKITNKNNKKYKLFNTGFINNSLCYLKELNAIIHNYFK